MSKQVIIVPSGILSNPELKELKENGYIVIVSDEPIKFLENDNKIQKTMEEIALYVLYNAKTDTNAHSMREWFSRLLLQRIGVEELKR